jgi:hypothetical protein
VDFFCNLSAKTKQSVTFEIKFVSHLIDNVIPNCFIKVSILVAVRVSGDYRTFF